MPTFFSPSSLPILLVTLTFPVNLSRSFSASCAVLPPPPNQLDENRFALFGLGTNSLDSGMRRMWYLWAEGSVRSHVSRRARLRRLDLKRLSRKSPMRGTIPTKTAARTLSSWSGR